MNATGEARPAQVTSMRNSRRPPRRRWFTLGALARGLAALRGSLFSGEHWMRPAAFCLAIGIPVAVFSVTLSWEAVSVREGETIPRAIYSPRTVRYLDEAQTARLRAEAQARVPKQYDVDGQAITAAQAGVTALFDAARQLGPISAAAGDLTDRVADLQMHSPLLVSAATLRLVATADAAYLNILEKRAKDAVNAVMTQRPIRDDVGEDLLEAKTIVAGRVMSSGLRSEASAAVIDVCQAALRPNRKSDPVATQKQRAAAADAVPPVYGQLGRGQVIANQGEVATPEIIQALQASGMLRAVLPARQVGWLLFYAVLLVGCAAVLGRHLCREAYANDGLLLAIAAMLAGGLTAIRAGAGTDQAWALGLASVSALCMVTAVLAGVTAGLLAGALAVGVLLAAPGTGPQLPVTLLCAALTASASVLSTSRRVRGTVRSAVIIGGANLLLFLLGRELGEGAVEWEPAVLRDLGVAAMTGPVAALAAFAFVLFLERPLGITTVYRLMELSSPNEPLLSELLHRAPGSYHSSVEVSNLAASAAEAVGADVLLARVAAMYHDIGKVKRPSYFTENQFRGPNPHDHISPTLSARVLAAHVKDGVELAAKNALPQPIIDIIEQHHGASVMTYFYGKAKALGEDIDEADFRYVGPKPRTKEAAVVMLADAAEAAVRSISEPHIARIRNMVSKVIDEKLEDGQLDECPLTLSDLRKVEEVLSEGLVGLFHTRVAYPEGLEAAERRERAGHVRPSGGSHNNRGGHK